MNVSTALVSSYSEALFNAAKAGEVLDVLNEQAGQLRALVEENGKFRSFLEAPNISRESKEELFVKVFGDSFHELLVNYIRMLIRRGRIELFFDSLDAFRERYAAHKGMLPASIVSAVALSEEQQAALKSALDRRLGKDLQIKYRVDQSVLGGIKFKAGDTLIDTTIRTGLDRLKVRLRQVSVY